MQDNNQTDQTGKNELFGDGFNPLLNSTGYYRLVFGVKFVLDMNLIPYNTRKKKLMFIHELTNLKFDNFTSKIQAVQDSDQYSLYNIDFTHSTLNATLTVETEEMVLKHLEVLRDEIYKNLDLDPDSIKKMNLSYTRHNDIIIIEYDKETKKFSLRYSEIDYFDEINKQRENELEEANNGPIE